MNNLLLEVMSFSVTLLRTLNDVQEEIERMKSKGDPVSPDELDRLYKKIQENSKKIQGL